ncbi:MAG TPA: tol-pal system protein YbgF [Rhizomicrobium sp.]|nr:tol-pal system protein YbgF [Rhizomicrobium sp.]
MNQRAVIFSLSLLLSAALIPQAQAQLFGPSDEEKAHEADQDGHLTNLDSQNQQLQARIQALEDQARSLVQTLSQATGNNEELRHQIDLLNQKVDQQQKDFAYRLCMISAQQLGAGADDQGLNCAATGMGQAAVSSQGQGQGGLQAGAPLPPLAANPPPAGAAPIRLTPPPGTLGSLSPSDAGVVAMRPPGGNQFDTAMNLLAKAQYDEAKASFRAYADANPDDTELSPQSIYWVGNINFIQHDYQGAMTAFAEQIKKYPKSVRGPDSMLKLGQSLLAMGRTQEGCTTLGAIKSKFPQAPAATLTLAAGTRKASCSK